MTLVGGSLDELEIQIILALQKDARKSYKSIAKKLGVAEGTVSNRVNRLTQQGVLKLEARVNPFAMSNKVAAILGINLKRSRHAGAAKKIMALPNVNAVWVTSGKYDIFVEVLVDSIKDLNVFIFEEELRNIEGIEAIETHIMLHSDSKYFKISPPAGSV
ncbi:Lrp/AsnC family transcriptional regulator [Desulfobacter hydrogenophilus]|uniref:Lrp/AsnC family transcriptional regulator n=1 Tax=Desulfobacter hydrogenophilus TaxID=2291 RepID=A0A328FEW0_9BACT|nr:Lrp/AsnC family transcriptional regulator [Desulfobacter hydrogenophilus]NDY71202.1 Lrp/AsnC family transcriptional regulator [Desulfobacter hydrogenophilus]QBH14201.1 Lrp/AsnC family transcriptional regulator [Desulfobacter hydrogenophilus]RAM02869.1 Lrp/AsnC family transcriptional regulator [Desulfobacter hydrogenophilus]